MSAAVVEARRWARTYPWLEDTATLEGTFFALNSGSKKHMNLHDEEILVRHGYHVLEKYLNGG